MSFFPRHGPGFVLPNLRWLAAGFLLTFLSSFGQTFFIGLFGNELRSTFHLSGGAFGSVYMVATLASAATLPWLGRTLDFMPGWKVAGFSLPLLGLACLLIAWAPNLAALTISIYMLRLFGQGMMTEIALTEAGRWFVTNRGKAMGIITQGQQVGSAILPALVVWLVQASGDWRVGWIASAAVLIFAGLPLVLALMRVERVPRSQESGAASSRTARDWTRKEVLRDPALYILLAGTVAPPFIGTVIFFHQGYLIALRGFDPLVFAGAYPVMALSTILFAQVCGYIVDRFGALRLLPLFLIPLAVASVAVALIADVWGVYLFMLLLGISNGFTFTLMGALWPEVYGLANLGGIRAITVSAMVLATAVGPGVTGLLIDAGIALPTQMLWLAGWCVVASILLAFAAQMVRSRPSRET